MKSIKEADQAIQSIIEGQTKLKQKLGAVVKQEQEAMQTVSAGVVSGESDIPIGNLVDLRIQKEALEEALQQTGQSLQDAQARRRDLELAELGGQWKGIEADLRASLARMRNLVGQKGLKGELDRITPSFIHAEIVADHYSQEAQIFLRKVKGFQSAAESALIDLWELLENIEHPGFDRNARDVNGEIPGFGKPYRRF